MPPKDLERKGIKDKCYLQRRRGKLEKNSKHHRKAVDDHLNGNCHGDEQNYLAQDMFKKNSLSWWPMANDSNARQCFWHSAIS